MKKKNIIVLALWIMAVLSALPAYAIDSDRYDDGNTQANLGISSQAVPLSEFSNRSKYADLYESQEIESLLSEVERDAKNEYYEDKVEYLNKTYNLNHTVESYRNFVDSFGLEPPFEFNPSSVSVIVSNETDSESRLIVRPDIWVIDYNTGDTSFKLKFYDIELDNPIENISGTVQMYYLQQGTWRAGPKQTINTGPLTAFDAGVVFTWDLDKYYVEEYFVCDITVLDNGITYSYSNRSNNHIIRTNYEAGPYSSLSANGGQRHHFIAATALTNNGFNSNSAYCMRMTAEDHRLTPSYGSSEYVREISNLLAIEEYAEAIKRERDELKLVKDSTGTWSLYAKYYDAIVVCISYYKDLFGIWFLI